MGTKNAASKNLKLPWHGWILAGILFLYSLAAAYDHVMSLSQGEIYYRASGMTDFQVVYFLAVPIWAVLAWTLSVWCGLFASVALLVRHRFATNLFAASLAGGLIYMLYLFVFSAGREAIGVIWFMPPVIAIITTAMFFYCRYLRVFGVLR